MELRTMLSSFSMVTIVALVALAPRLYRRLLLSRAKHPSLRGHAHWSRRVARAIRFFEYDEDSFYVSDAAPEAVARKRRGGLQQLRRRTQATSPLTVQMNES